MFKKLWERIFFWFFPELLEELEEDNDEWGCPKIGTQDPENPAR